MAKKRLDWEQYFMLQSIILSQRSTCDRANVGAVVVKDKRIIASGYNGSTNKEDHCDDEGHYMRDGHCIRTVHAEVNAITQCSKFGMDTQGAEVYVTHFPCLNCTKTLIQAGIKKINYLTNYRVDDYALHLLNVADVEIKKVELDNTNQLVKSLEGITP